ncbi:hypothetical protein GW750_09670 [bacterium]|nr:hypothetical protein [bacterium]
MYFALVAGRDDLVTNLNLENNNTSSLRIFSDEVVPREYIETPIAYARDYGAVTL